MRNQLETIPVYVNPGSGSAAEVCRQLADDPRIELYRLVPGKLRDEIQQQVNAGVRRIIVSGGDGTIALAAACVAGTGTVLGILPGGTLNHFAGRFGIPDDFRQALQIALGDQVVDVDVGYVNEHLFINTSSVGAYVAFVRSREYLERRLSYMTASILAGFKRLYRLRSARVFINSQSLKTPLVFVGVGQRELQFPLLGQAVEQGESGLHMIAVKSESRWHTLKLGVQALLFGIDPLNKTRQLASCIGDAFELSYRRSRYIQVAADGELLRVQSPVRYRFAAAALRIAVPAAATGAIN